MRCRLASIAFLFLALSSRAVDFALTNGDRIEALGNSQTLDPTGAWNSFVTAYCALRHPELNLQFLNPSESGLGVTGCFTNGSAYYDEFAYAFQPTKVIEQVVAVGGLSQAAWQSNLTVLNDVYVTGRSSASILIIGANPEARTGGGGFGGYTAADVAVAQSYSPNKIVVTNWGGLDPLFEIPGNQDALKVDPIGDPSNFHMSKAGNVLTAWEVIKELAANTNVSGFDTNVSFATIDAATASVSLTNGCTITNLTGNSSGVTFVRRDSCLPWAIDESGRHDATNIQPKMIGWQNYRLTITNLLSGNYAVTIGGTNVATVSSATLAAGWNMADLTRGPIFDKCQEVLGRVRDLQDIDRVDQTNLNTTKGWSLYRASCLTAYGDNGKRGATLIADAGIQTSLTSITNLNSAIRTAAQPEDFTFAVTKVQPTINVTTINVGTLTISP